MNTGNPLVLLLMCSSCKGMSEKLLPEVQFRFAENVRVMAVSCPSELDPFVFVKLLRKSCDGLVVACPRDACCCPENKAIMKRREIIKDILPVFGLHREQFKIASVTPYGKEQLFQTIDDMIEFLKTEHHNRTECNFLEEEGTHTNILRWVN